MNNRKISLIRPSQVFDTFFDEFFNAPSNSNLNTVFTDSMDVDMYEEKDSVVVEARVPGFKKDDINVKIEDNMLIIEGSNKHEEERKDGRKYHIKEVSSQSIYRSIMLPHKVDSDKTIAEFKNGILKIVMPKMGEGRAKSISINE